MSVEKLDIESKVGGQDGFSTMAWTRPFQVSLQLGGLSSPRTHGRGHVNTRGEVSTALGPYSNRA